METNIEFEFNSTFFHSSNGINEKILNISIYELENEKNEGSTQINLSLFAEKTFSLFTLLSIQNFTKFFQRNKSNFLIRKI